MNDRSEITIELVEPDCFPPGSALGRANVCAISIQRYPEGLFASVSVRRKGCYISFYLGDPGQRALFSTELLAAIDSLAAYLGPPAVSPLPDAAHDPSLA